MNKSPKWKIACQCAVSDGVPRRSFYVALMVGTILNLINCRNVRTCETSFNLSLNGRKDDHDVQIQARCGPQAAGAPTR